MKINQILFCVFLYLFATVPDVTNAQTIFGRSPSARAEAMGKAYGSVDGDLTCIAFNPAGTATIKGIEVDGAYSLHYNILTQAYDEFFSAGYRFNRYLTAAVSANIFNYGEELAFMDMYGNTIPFSPSPSLSNYTFNVSSEPVEDLLVGVNANYYEEHFAFLPNIPHAFYLDFGVIKKFRLSQDRINYKTLSVSGNMTNITSSATQVDYGFQIINDKLPMLTTLGVNYQSASGGKPLLDSLHPVCFLVSIEAQTDVGYPHSEYIIHAGTEILISEILALRAGFYGVPTGQGNAELTYGLGLQLPLYKMGKTPLNIAVDFTMLPQSTELGSYGFRFQDFTSLNLRLNYIFKNK